MVYLIEMPVEYGSKDILAFEVDGGEAVEGLVLAAPEPGKVADQAPMTLRKAWGNLKPSLRNVIYLQKRLPPTGPIWILG